MHKKSLWFKVEIKRLRKSEMFWDLIVIIVILVFVLSYSFLYIGMLSLVCEDRHG